MALKAKAPVLWLRGAALEAQDFVAGIAPANFVTGDGGARGLDVEAGVAVSMRRPGMRGEKPADGQRSRNVSAERWTSLEHENLVKLLLFPLAVLGADAREVPYCRPFVSCRRGRYKAGARSGFHQGCERHRNGCQRRGQQRKTGARAGLRRGGQTQTAGYLVPCVL